MTDKQGCFVCGQFTVADQTFSLYNIYGLNKSRDGDLFLIIISGIDPRIMCGHFNTMVDPQKDHQACNPLSPWAYN